MAKGYGGVQTSYTPVEYIESSGTQYIDTRFKHNQNTRMVADLSFSDISSWSYPFGSFGGSSGTNKLFCAEINNEFHLGSYFGSAQTTNIIASGRHSFDLNKNVHKIDNSTYTFSAVTMQSEYNDLVFGATGYNGNANLPHTKIKLYSFKLYDNGTLIRDFIPVIDQDNIACLYDLVEGNFYYNKGTGTFTAGNATGSPVMIGDKARKLIKGYAGKPSYCTPVEYIESDGNQWIDTGIVYDYATTQFDIDFQYLPSDNAGYISVSWSGSNHDAYVLGSSGTSSSGSIICATAQVDSWTTIATKDANRHQYTYNNSSHQIIYDGSVISNRTTVNINGVVTMRIFRGPGSNNPAKARIYGYKISNIVTQELIRDFVPVLDSFNVACLYERVEGKLYYNKGTGTFIAGSTTGEPVYIGSFARRIKKGYVGVQQSYTPIEYIESSGTQYIDTGIRPNQNTGFEVDFIIHNPINSSGFASVLGSSDTDRLSLNTYPATDGGELYVKDTAYNPYITQNIRKQITYKNSVFSDNDGNTYTVSKTFSIAQPLFLFTRNINGTPSTEYSSMVLFGAKFYDGDTLIRDYIPVLDGDGEPCLYDKVEGKFYYNKGAGTFTAGSTIGSPVELGDKARLIFEAIPAYTPLSYIEGNGTQYIDTEVFINDNTCVDVKFAGTRSSSNDYLCGADNPLYHIGGISGNYLMVSANGGDYYKLAWADTSIHTIVYNDINKKIKYDGSIYEYGTATIPDSLTSMYLFTKNPASGTRRYTKVYYCKISNRLTGELYRDLVPAIRQEDGVVCLFDKVSNKFFVNKGTGNFIAGPAI